MMDHGLRARVRMEEGGLRGGRRAEEGQPRAVRRPHGLAVTVHARIDPAQRLRRHVVDADEAVVAPAAHEGQLRAVGREAQLPGASPGLHPRHRLRLIRERRPEDLASFQEGHAVSARRDGRSAPGRDAHRLAAVERDAPHGLLGALRVAGGIGHVSLPVGAAAADVDQGLGVRRPLRGRRGTARRPPYTA